MIHYMEQPKMNKQKNIQEEPIRQFGIQKEGAIYIPRPGAYLIAFNDEKKIAVDVYRGKYLFPGGGLDPGESADVGLVRELREELGAEILSSRVIGRANEYVDAFDGYFNKMFTFYTGELVGNNLVSLEEGHTFLWVTPEEFRQNARHPAQVWALEMHSSNL